MGFIVSLHVIFYNIWHASALDYELLYSITLWPEASMAQLKRPSTVVRALTSIFLSSYMLVLIYLMTCLREKKYFSHKMGKIGPYAWRS
jgi:hypothetical protein